MPDETLVFHWDGPSFEIADMFNADKYRIAVKYADKNVLQSGLLDRVKEGGSLLEQNRIPLDDTWKYDTTDAGASVVVFRTSKRLKENIEALHEFIYGDYYPAD